MVIWEVHLRRHGRLSHIWAVTIYPVADDLCDLSAGATTRAHFAADVGFDEFSFEYDVTVLPRLRAGGKDLPEEFAEMFMDFIEQLTNRKRRSRP
jgi:hypothetical protein